MKLTDRHTHRHTDRQTVQVEASLELGNRRPSDSLANREPHTPATTSLPLPFLITREAEVKGKGEARQVRRARQVQWGGITGRVDREVSEEWMERVRRRRKRLKMHRLQFTWSGEQSTMKERQENCRITRLIKRVVNY